MGKEKVKIVKRIVSIIVLLLIGGLLFYWYEWRPSEARKNCHKYAVEAAIRDGKSQGEFQDDDYKFRLQYCLQREGMK